MRFLKYNKLACNNCNFNRSKHNHRYPFFKGRYTVEQIVKGATLTLCRYHLVRYALKRFKWWVNKELKYVPERLTGKWHIR